MSDTFAADVKLGILLRDGDICAMLGSSPACRGRADADPNHRLNRGAGGSSLEIVNSPANGCAICRVCNSLIETDAGLAEEARRRGVKVEPGVSSYAVITETPLWSVFFRQWLILTMSSAYLTGDTDSTRDARDALILGNEDDGFLLAWAEAA